MKGCFAISSLAMYVNTAYTHQDQPDMVTIYIFSYLFHIISDIISQNGIYDMILYQLKFWDRRYDIISYFGKKLYHIFIFFSLECLELKSVILANSLLPLSLKKFDTAAWAVLANSSMKVVGERL